MHSSIGTLFAARRLIPSVAIRLSRSRAEILFIIVSCVSLVCWLMLYDWYSLFQHKDTPYYGFDKVPWYTGLDVIHSTSLIFVALSASYFLGYMILNTRQIPSRAMKLSVCFYFISASIINILIYPVGALDVFNYMIWLKLAFYYDMNPYITNYMSFLGDSFAQSSFLNHVSLFYGPVWLLLSGIPSSLVGFHDPTRVLLSLKVLNVVLLAVTGLFIYAYIDDLPRKWIGGYLFLANPLVLFEGIANVHNDVMMTLFLVAALAALKQRSSLAGPALALSSLVKFFALSLLPLFAVAALMSKWSRAKVLLSMAASVGIIVLMFAPFWADGELPGALSRSTDISQEYDSASIFSLVREYLRRENAPEETLDRVRVVFGVLFAVAALAVTWSVRRGRAVEDATIDTFFFFALLVSLLPPWYLILVIALLALRRSSLGTIYLFAATLLALVYYPLSIWVLYGTDWSFLRLHLFQALLVAVPMIVYLGIEALTGWARLRGSRACSRAGPV